jgi:hypothetical protein
LKKFKSNGRVLLNTFLGSRDPLAHQVHQESLLLQAVAAMVVEAMAAAAGTALVPMEAVLMLSLKSFADLLARRDLQVPLDTKEKLGLRELLAITEDQDHKDLLENPVHLVTLDQKGLRATTALQALQANLATTERKELLVTTEHPVCLEDPVYQEKTVTMVLPDLRDPKVKLALKVTPFHPKSPDLLVHLATQAKMVKPVTMAVPVPLDQSAQLDFKDHLANQAPMAILVDQDPKEKLDFPAMTVPPVKMEFLVLLAKFQDLLGHLDLLDHLATMVLLAKMVFPALLVIRAKTESLDLQDTRVQFEFKFFLLLAVAI